ncbi:MAG TPA: amidohydrolase family protein, partial [Thermoanaerobaculia bacterium]|nr:amidohydrolase family protein [Thermoanaerobaculia bacterium]
MKPMRSLALTALAALTLSLAPAGSDAARPERADSFAVTNVRVFDGLRVIPDATVVVRNGRIHAVGRHLDVPPNLPEIDGSGKTLMPGIIDSHGHARERRELERAAQFGITTLMDMQSVNPFATQMYGEQRRGEAHDRADFFSAINPATVEEGYPYIFTPDVVETPTLDSPEEADEFVRRRIAEGSTHIKIFLENGELFGFEMPVLSRETVRALVRATHRRGRLAVAHVTLQRFGRQAIEDGVDGLVHAFPDTPVTDSLLGLARSRGIFLVGTVAITESFITTAGGQALVADPELSPYLTAEEIDSLLTPGSPNPLTLENLEILKDNVGRFHGAGIPVLTGSDSPLHGPTVHRDLELLVESGLTPREALIGATSAAARVYGLRDRGRIAPGQRADLLLVEGDPTVDIKATRALRKIWKGGAEVARPLNSTLSASEPPTGPSPPRPSSPSLPSTPGRGGRQLEFVLGGGALSRGWTGGWER